MAALLASASIYIVVYLVKRELKCLWLPIGAANSFAAAAGKCCTKYSLTNTVGKKCENVKFERQ